MATGDENTGVDSQASKRAAGALSELGRVAMGTMSTFFSLNPTITDLTSHMGALGKTVAFVETQFQFMRGLSSRGITFGFQIDQMVEAAAGARMNFQELGKIVDENAERMGLFGAGVDRGLQEYLTRQRQFFFNADLSATQYATNLQRLGYTVNEINDTLLVYDIITRSTYNRERRVTEERNQAAMEFARELDLVAKLTGKQRQQMQDEIVNRQRQGDFIAFSRNISEQGQRQMTRSMAMLNSLPENVRNLIYDGITAGFPKSSETRAIYAPFSQAADAAAELGRRLEAGDISDAEFDQYMNRIMRGAMTGMQDPMMDLARFSGTGSSIIDAFSTTLGQSHGSFIDAVEQHRQQMERAQNRRVTTEEAFNDVMEKLRRDQANLMSDDTGTTRSFNNLLISMNDMLAAGSVRAQERIAGEFYRGLATEAPAFQRFLQERAGPIINDAVDDVAQAAQLLLRGARGELGEDAQQIINAVQAEINAGNFSNARRIATMATDLAAMATGPDGPTNMSEYERARQALAAEIQRVNNLGNLPQMSTELLQVTGNIIVNGQVLGPDGQPLGRSTTLPTSPTQESIGSLGVFGRLFKDYGPGEDVTLHNMEAVLTPRQLGDIVSTVATASLRSSSRAMNSTVEVAGRLVNANYQNYTRSLDGMLNTVRSIVVNAPSTAATVDISGIETTMRTLVTEIKQPLSEMTKSLKEPLQTLVVNSGEQLTVTKDAVRRSGRGGGNGNLLQGIGIA